MTVEKRTPSFDWDDARFFLAAYREGSFLGASRELGVSHSTVKRRIEKFEDTLGARLFTPTADGLLPTDSAIAVVDIAEQVESAAEHFGSRLLGESREVGGLLTVTVVDGMSGLLSPVVKAFNDRFPGVDVRFTTNDRLLDLRRREADVAVRLTTTPDEDLFGRKIGDLHFRPFACHELKTQFGNELSDYPWVTWDQSVGATLTEAWFRQTLVGKTPILRVTHTTSLVEMVAAGIGAAILPEPLGHRANLEPIGALVPELSSEVWCLCHQDLRFSSRVRGFMEETARNLVL